jgi:hypothetical protein
MDSGRHKTWCRVLKYWAGESEPYEVIETEDNVFTTVGVSLMLDLLAGAGGTVFNNSNARIGVGTSSTAESSTQTDLLGTNLRKGMDATYPSRSGTILTFQSTFGTSDANFAWNEWGIFNSASGATMFNRKAQSFGTKVSGSTWVIQASITVI